MSTTPFRLLNRSRGMCVHLSASRVGTCVPRHGLSESLDFACLDALFQPLRITSLVNFSMARKTYSRYTRLIPLPLLR
jgi:hypothetical protein